MRRTALPRVARDAHDSCPGRVEGGGLHRVHRRLQAGPGLELRDGLREQHLQAVDDPASRRLRLAQHPGVERVVHHVQDDGARPVLLGGQRGLVDGGPRPDRGGVDQDVPRVLVGVGQRARLAPQRGRDLRGLGRIARQQRHASALADEGQRGRARGASRPQDHHRAPPTSMRFFKGTSTPMPSVVEPRTCRRARRRCSRCRRGAALRPPGGERDVHLVRPRHAEPDQVERGKRLDEGRHASAAAARRRRRGHGLQGAVWSTGDRLRATSTADTPYTLVSVGHVAHALEVRHLAAVSCPGGTRRRRREA